MLFVYILRCADGTFFVGKTDKIQPCLAAHHAGKASLYTQRRLPVDLVYLEGPRLPKDADARERELAGWTPQKQQQLITRTERRCVRLRAQILASGPAIDAIGGPGAISGVRSAQQLSAALSFIRFDQACDALELRHVHAAGKRK